MSLDTFSGFYDHSKLKGLHAFLGASKYHWLNYDENKIIQSYLNFKAAEKGTELHDFADRCIKLRQKLPHSKKTLNMYVNDAIGFRMVPEQVLFYSENCFGTTDAICFREQPNSDRKILRIHDYKSGLVPAHMEQLQIYAALFCLEYKISAYDIDIELRIYQNDEIVYDRPDPELIMVICKKIIENDKILNKLKEGE